MNEALSIARTVFVWGARIALWPARVAGARAALRQLAAMDARELADIGLVPQDLRDATALPLDGDPTALFVARAREARICAGERRPSRSRAPRTRGPRLERTGS